MGPDSGPSFDAPPPPIAPAEAGAPPINPEPVQPSPAPEASEPIIEAGDDSQDPKPAVVEEADSSQEPEHTELTENQIKSLRHKTAQIIEDAEGNHALDQKRGLYLEATTPLSDKYDSQSSSNIYLARIDALEAIGTPESLRLAADWKAALSVRQADRGVVPYSGWDRASGNNEDLVGFNFGEVKDPVLVRADVSLDKAISDLRREIGLLRELGGNAKEAKEKARLLQVAQSARIAQGELGPMYKLSVMRYLSENGVNVSEGINELSPNEAKYQEDLDRFMTESGVDPKVAKKFGKMVREKGLSEAMAQPDMPNPKGLEEKIFGRALSPDEAVAIAKAFLGDKDLKKFNKREAFWILILAAFLMPATEIAKAANPLSKQNQG